MKLTLVQRAILDVEANALHLEHEVQGLGVRFVEATEETYRLLLRHPEIAGHLETESANIADLRVWPVKGFPNHLLYYRVRTDEIRVLRKLHASMDFEKHLTTPER